MFTLGEGNSWLLIRLLDNLPFTYDKIYHVTARSLVTFSKIDDKMWAKLVFLTWIPFDVNELDESGWCKIERESAGVDEIEKLFQLEILGTEYNFMLLKCCQICFRN